MRRGLLLLACLALPAAAIADVPARNGSSFDVAPTLLELKNGQAGLFYVTSHADHPVTIQIEALDWSQDDGNDALAPSETLFTSPPLARILPGTRQSIRVLARRPAGDRFERAYRLRVSELPDTRDRENGVRVLLQFSIPVFADHAGGVAPDLDWAMAAPDAVTLRNKGRETVKLTELAVNGAALGAAFTYVLPGATRRFRIAAPAAHLRITGHDERSGRDIAVDLSAVQSAHQSAHL